MKGKSDLVWLNDISVGEDVEFGNNGHHAEEVTQESVRKANIEAAVRSILDIIQHNPVGPFGLLGYHLKSLLKIKANVLRIANSRTQENDYWNQERFLAERVHIC